MRLWRIPSAFGSRYQVSAVFLCCFLLLHSPMMLAWGKLALAASSAMHGGALQHVCYCTAQVLRRVTRPAALWVHATATSSCCSVLSCKAFQADVFLGAWLEAEALQLRDKGRCRRLLHILGSVGSFAPLTGVVRVVSGMHGQRCAAFTSFLAGGHQRHMIVQTAWTAAGIGS